MALIWLIEVAVRNPNRIRNFLKTLTELEGETWSEDTQARYQILLLKNKYYGYGVTQFFNGLSKQHIELLNSNIELSYEQSKEIMESKNYVGGLAMRGRLSFNPLEKMGLGYIDSNKVIRISPTGYYLLQEDYDLGKVFFKSFLKWQLPNPDMKDFNENEGYAIKPFVGTLKLIYKVNSICKEKGFQQKGISRLEFKLFALTLINYKEIENQATRLIDFREQYEKINGSTEKEIFVDAFVESNLSHFNNFKNANDYMDNAIRFFRLTRYVHIRGNGWYVDLEPRRMIEIERLLNTDNASPILFENKEKYIQYIGDMSLPHLPWERIEDLKAITQTLIDEIVQYHKLLTDKGILTPTLNFENFQEFNTDELLFNIENLRELRKKLNEIEIKFNSQEILNIQNYIDCLKGIYQMPNRTIMLEKYSTLALNALNDALQIKPNYPVGDDNEPTFTAPGNKPDIECFYATFNSLCEVTLLRDKSQWFNEGQPVMRHLRNFEDNNPDKDTYCLFIAPSLHRDTVNTFWISVKYEYEGRKQKIIPMRIQELIILLEYLLMMKNNNISLTHTDLLNLYNSIIDNSTRLNDSTVWVNEIPNQIKNWAETKLGIINAN